MDTGHAAIIIQDFKTMAASWGTAALLMIFLWLIQIRTKNAAIADVGWAAGIGIAAAITAASFPGNPARKILGAGLAIIWAARLATHILIDRVIKKPEDARYQAMRKRWGKRPQFYFFFFFQAQALVIAALTPAFIALASNLKPFGIWDALGTALWATALIGEFMADRQLAFFRDSPQNKGLTCRNGLWRYSRHPNYFFEALLWWSYVFLAIGSPQFRFSLISPILILFFLLYVTGIPWTEAQALASRGDDYRHYQKMTSAFIPWFHKESR